VTLRQVSFAHLFHTLGNQTEIIILYSPIMWILKDAFRINYVRGLLL